MIEIEIYLHDLKKQSQKELLEFLGAKDAKELNLDTIPLFTLSKPDSEILKDQSKYFKDFQK